MKKIRYTFFGIIVLIVILMIAALFLPKEYSLQAESKIDSSKSIVYNLLLNLDNRSQWDPISRQPNVVLETANDNTVFSWSIDDVRAGSIKVKASTNAFSIILEEFVENKEKPNNIEYALVDGESQGTTNVIVEYTGQSSWPMNLFNILFKIKKSNKLIAELDQLEVIAKEREIDRLYNGYKIQELIVKERNFIIRRGNVISSAMQQFYVQNLGMLFKDVQEAGVQIDGMPCGLFYSDSLSSKMIDMAAAIPVAEEVNIKGSESQNIKTRTGIVVDYYGDYGNTVKAHKAIKSYAADYNYVIDKPIIEEYVTDPVDEKDPNKWLTRITYYVKGK